MLVISGVMYDMLREVSTVLENVHSSILSREALEPMHVHRRERENE